MIQRPWYQISISLLTIGALAAAVWLLVSPAGPPGIEITLPDPSEQPEQLASSDAAGDGGAPRIDINTASVQLLETLPGIGPVLASRIVEYREQNGPFERTDQLTAVRGIGSATYERLRPLVGVGE